MTCTESEAKKRFCPHSRQMFVWPFSLGGDPAGTAATFNRMDEGGIPAGCHCLASECMMWRSTKQAVNETIDKELPKGEIPKGNGWEATDSGTDEPDEPTGKPYHWVNWRRTISEEGEGYCGLAGKP